MPRYSTPSIKHRKWDILYFGCWPLRVLPLNEMSTYTMAMQQLLCQPQSMFPCMFQ